MSEGNEIMNRIEIIEPAHVYLLSENCDKVHSLEITHSTCTVHIVESDGNEKRADIIVNVCDELAIYHDAPAEPYKAHDRLVWLPERNDKLAKRLLIAELQDELEELVKGLQSKFQFIHGVRHAVIVET